MKITKCLITRNSHERKMYCGALLLEHHRPCQSKRHILPSRNERISTRQGLLACVYRECHLLLIRRANIKHKTLLDGRVNRIWLPDLDVKIVKQ